MDAIYSTEYTLNELNYASSNVVYISLPDNNTNCSNWFSQLPSLPSGWSYRCSATPTNIDGTGWIPIPFSNFPILNISQLPIDPLNKSPYYYSFVVGGSYKVTAKPEENYSPAINDGGIEPLLYEAGTDKKLSTFQSGLVLYLPFDEGSGTTARDLSGFGNNGTLCNGGTCPAQGPTWTTGKVGSALSFDGVDDYVSMPHSASLGLTEEATLMAWVKTVSTSPLYQIVISKGSDPEPYRLWVRDTAVNSVFIIAGTRVETGVSSPSKLNRFAFVAVAFNRGVIKYYQDGELLGTTDKSSIGTTLTVNTAPV
jgi:hypothetical protein